MHKCISQDEDPRCIDAAILMIISKDFPTKHIRRVIQTCEERLARETRADIRDVLEPNICDLPKYLERRK